MPIAKLHHTPGLSEHRPSPVERDPYGEQMTLHLDLPVGKGTLTLSITKMPFMMMDFSGVCVVRLHE